MKHLYTANLHNEVVIFASDLEALIEKFSKCEPTFVMQSVKYYKEELKKRSTIVVYVSEERVYILQHVY